MNPYQQRKLILGGIIILVFLIFIIRLFFLQVIDQSYKMSASNNVLRYITQYPARGLMYDRNGKLIVYNQAAYDLMVLPNQLKAFDTATFCSLLGISKELAVERINQAKHYSYFKPSIFLEQISGETYGPFQESLYKFKGFFVQTRSLRIYPDKIAAHVVGYIGEVNEKTTQTNPYYKSGDYIGISGVEKSYEEVLRGQKGVEIFMVDVHNRIKGQYKKGRYDTLAINGSDLKLTIDADLQAYGEKLMQNKLGSIVAIEPSTGEILVMVSSPSYDPELLVGRQRAANYNLLKADSLNPIFDRALMARYPPGSTFKTVNALIGLKEGVLYEGTRYSCYGGYTVGNFHMGCHNHFSPLNLTQAVQHSCNAYFAAAYRNLLDNSKYSSVGEAYKIWRNHVLSFGLGSKLDVDLPHEVNGYIPTLDYYERIYGVGKVKSMNVVSLSIGQGELLLTPIQMANLASTIANRGYYYRPHIVKEIIGKDDPLLEPYRAKHFTDVDPVFFTPIVQGMFEAVNGDDGGTGHIAQFGNIEVCGKTGTAQNPHGKDHSIFMAFAPKDNPRIAISVYVENCGFGATWAAPIASLIMEKYLTDSISRPALETFILNGDLVHGTTRTK
jgi:penicillin-binding protein 2